jgi:hypothetical protein
VGPLIRPLGEDLILEAKKGQSYEIKMELKKHNLLGGPIQSNWK